MVGRFADAKVFLGELRGELEGIEKKNRAIGLLGHKKLLLALFGVIGSRAS